MNVLPVLDAVLAQLREKLPQLQVEYFPEKPAEYRLNHPVGALLVSYAGSRFDKPNDIGAVLQTQTIQLCVTVVFRQLNGKRGAIDVLDAVRRILGGYTPPNCRRRSLSASTQIRLISFGPNRHRMVSSSTCTGGPFTSRSRTHSATPRFESASATQTMPASTKAVKPSAKNEPIGPNVM